MNESPLLLPALCEHDILDDKKQRCSDCHVSGKDLHELWCGDQDDWEITPGGICDHCGFSLR